MNKRDLTEKENRELSSALLGLDCIIIPLKIAKIIGYNSTIFLQFLLGEEEEYATKNEMKEDGFFPATLNKVEKFLFLSRTKQDYAIKKLIQINFIQSKLLGIPAKRHFKINHDALLEVIVNPL